MFDKRQTDKSWGMVWLYRTQSNGTSLFQSDLKHNNFIALKIMTAYKYRDLNKDWVFGDKNMIEVWLSPTQFAEMITCMNMGSGVPCTIKYTEKDGVIEYKEEENRLDLIYEEQDKKIDNAITDIDDTIKLIKELIETKKISKSVGYEIVRKLETSSYTMKSNGGEFIKNQAKEHLDKMVVEAKSTVEAFVEHKIRETGLQALKEMADLQIENKKGDEKQCLKD